jgi:hypothetical protein
VRVRTSLLGPSRWWCSPHRIACGAASRGRSCKPSVTGLLRVPEWCCEGVPRKDPAGGAGRGRAYGCDANPAEVACDYAETPLPSGHADQELPPAARQRGFPRRSSTQRSADSSDQPCAADFCVPERRHVPQNFGMNSWKLSNGLWQEPVGAAELALSDRGLDLRGSARAGDRDRTGMTSLEGWGSTIELHPHARPQSARPNRTW